MLAGAYYWLVQSMSRKWVARVSSSGFEGQTGLCLQYIRESLSTLRYVPNPNDRLQGMKTTNQ